MIERVSFSGTTYNELPYKFEAGTPNIAGAIGFGAAVDYLQSFDRSALLAYEATLLAYLTEQAKNVSGLRVIGQAKDKVAVLSFLIEGAHPADVGALLDQQGVAVRTGHHCAQPLMEHLGIPGTVRASLSIYNTHEDIDRFIQAVKKAKTFLC